MEISNVLKEEHKILIVEDERLTANNLKKTIEKFGYTITDIVNNGAGAIESVKNNPPDLILVDIKIKGELDGIQTSELLNELSDAAIIYLTAYSDEHTINRAKLTTPYSYIVKPFRSGELHTAIEMTLYRRKLSKKIQESELKFRLLVTKMEQGLAVHEVICNENGKPVDYRFLDVNESFEKITGLKREHIIGKTVLEVLPNTEDYWIEKYGHVALTGEALHFENYSNELGKYFDVVVYQPQQNQFAVIVTDITDRKEADNKLQISTKRYKELLRNLNVGVVVHNNDTSISIANKKASELLDLSIEQLRGKKAVDPGWKFFDENGLTLQLQEYPVNKILSERRIITNTVYTVFRPSKNDKVYLLVNGFPFVDENSNITEIVISFIDITDIKAAEKELKEQMNEINRFNELMVGREEKMILVKEEVNALLEKIGEPKKYNIISEK